jgi:hypothetical protein
VCITTGVSPNQNIEVIHTQFVARRYIVVAIAGTVASASRAIGRLPTLVLR